MRDGAPPDAPSARPRALKIVALLFVASGLYSALKMAVSPFSSIGLSLDFGVLGLWIGPGLLKLKPKWLKWAKTFTWFDLVAIDLVGIVVSFSHQKAKYRFGPWSGELGGKATVAVLIGSACVGLWKLRVLKRPEIEELFLSDEAAEEQRYATSKPRVQLTEPLPPAIGSLNLPANAAPVTAAGDSPSTGSQQ